MKRYEARVAVESLNEARFGETLCYPTWSAGEFSRRLDELRKLGISAIDFSGQRRVGSVPVLGKGCVGIVVKALREDREVALKVRRTDANRPTMQREALMLRAANKVTVGPRFLGVSQNVLLMEFIDGLFLEDWVKRLEGQGANVRLRRVLRRALEQAWRLDRAGLDHGELSNASKHLMVRFDDVPFIVDFETASKTRQVSNVTSLSQFLFVGGGIAETLQEKLGAARKNHLVAALKVYKKVKNRGNFEQVLREARLE
ncbi:MAG: serine/threonine protein kinase [Candidatus Bathyarchaeota archaeon]|nr:serine/threonine protein kinase [Candidatus Bathyarchaeota archaeon]